MKKIILIAAIAVASLGLVACGSNASCACSEKTAWCEKCEVGHVNGKKVACEGCYAVKTGKVKECESCKK